VVWDSLNLLNVRLVSDFVFAFKRSADELVLNKLNIEDGSVLWSLRLDDNEEIQRCTQIELFTDRGESKPKVGVMKLLGVYKGYLWVAMKSHFLLKIDVETGAIAHIVCEVPDAPTDFTPVVPSPSTMHLDARQGKLIGLIGTFYCEVDCDTGIGRIVNLKNEFQNYLYQSPGYIGTLYHLRQGGQTAFDADYLYLSDRNPNSVAALDRKTLKVAWWHEFMTSRVSRQYLNKLQVVGNRLYVLIVAVGQNDGTLHIFDRV
jgi:hypothetical protein